MAKIAVVGGTGLTELDGLKVLARHQPETPYGPASAALVEGSFAGIEVLFLARHGAGHRLPPHRINYRANIWALKTSGVERIVAINAVGGIRPEPAPGELAIPDQLIDYTWSRPQTFFDGDDGEVCHIDFSQPYSPAIRAALCEAARRSAIAVTEQCTYGVTQGPRLETPAEIDRLERDGCDLVGMTGMPEAALARELDVSYAACAVVANYAAGRGSQTSITMDEIRSNLARGMRLVYRLLAEALPSLAA